MPSEFVEHRKFGPVLVNSEVSGFQGNPKVAAFSDGRYVVVWNDESGLGADTEVSSVKGRIYSGSGAPLTGEFLVNQITADAQYLSSVAVIDGDRFVVSWTSLDPEASGNADAQARIFTTAGVPVGDEFPVSNAAGYQEGAILTRLGNGGFFATWTDYGASGTTSDGDVKGQCYDANGVKLGAELMVNTITTGNQALPDVALLKNGRFVVTWSDAGVVGDGLGGPFDSSLGGIKGQIFEADGSKVGNEIAINGQQFGLQSNSTIAALSDGGFVVGWTDFSTDSKALGRVFDGLGSARTGSLFLGVSTIDQQSSPELVAWQDGGFLAVYSTGASGNFSTQDVVARGFSDTGIGRTYETIVNAGRFGLQLEPSAAILADGSVAIAWRHVRDNAASHGDGSGPSVLQTGFTMNADIARSGTLIGTYSDDHLTGDQGSDTLLGYGGNDLLEGKAGANRMYGGAGDDTLIGGIDDDLLDGGLGRDQLNGGMGDDLYLVDDRFDVVAELLNGGIDTVKSSAAVTVLAANVENLTLVDGGGHGAAIGNAANNIIRGNIGRDEIFGQAGNDMLYDGGGSADALFGGTGDDIYYIDTRSSSTIEVDGEGTDEVRTTSYIYWLQSFVENLTAADNADHGALVGNALDNLIIGGTGRDDLFGREGNDTLRGGAGTANTLIGQQGNDTYIVEAAGDSILEYAGEGIDTVRTAMSQLVLSANVEQLVYTGNEHFTGIGNNGSNALVGGSGTDFLSGLDSDDVLIGGSGADELLGGSGPDQFRYMGGEIGFDRIFDFASGSDKIVLVRSGFSYTDSFNLVQSAVPVPMSNDSTFLYNSTDGMLRYDPDGTGVAGATVLAQLNAGLTLQNSDFLVLI